MKTIQHILKEMGKSQTWLAREAGVSTATICLIIQGKRSPSPEAAKKIEQLLDGRVTAYQLRTATRLTGLDITDYPSSYKFP